MPGGLHTKKLEPSQDTMQYYGKNISSSPTTRSTNSMQQQCRSPRRSPWNWPAATHQHGHHHHHECKHLRTLCRTLVPANWCRQEDLLLAQQELQNLFHWSPNQLKTSHTHYHHRRPRKVLQPSQHDGRGPQPTWPTQDPRWSSSTTRSHYITSFHAYACNKLTSVLLGPSVSATDGSTMQSTNSVQVPLLALQLSECTTWPCSQQPQN